MIEPQTIRACTRDERSRGICCQSCINPPKYVVITRELYPSEFGAGRTEMKQYLCGVHAQPWLRKRKRPPVKPTES